MRDFYQIWLDDQPTFRNKWLSISVELYCELHVSGRWVGDSKLVLKRVFCWCCLLNKFYNLFRAQTNVSPVLDSNCLTLEKKTKKTRTHILSHASDKANFLFLIPSSSSPSLANTPVYIHLFIIWQVISHLSDLFSYDMLLHPTLKILKKPLTLLEL